MNPTNVGFNELEAEPIVKEEGGRGSVHIDENTKEVESDGIYIGRIFGEEEEAYDTNNLYTLTKGFG